MLNRSDWTLLFLGADAGPFPTDQVRVSKGLFLASQIPAHPLHGWYNFEAYESGPIDSSVYRDLDALQLAGLINVHHNPGSARKTYDLTEQGERRVRELRRDVSPEHLAAIGRIKRQVTSQSLDELLQQINSDFPEYVVNGAERIA